jgi:threonine/homoserine/homoserine lactone efflux protein
LITAIIIGFITGWLISMPLGPVNASVISRTLSHSLRYGLAVGIGAAIMDVIYCGFAAQIHQFLLSAPIINLSFQVLGFFVLVFVGYKTLKTKAVPVVAATTEERSEELAIHELKRLHLSTSGYVESFALGVVLYASNVAGVPEWIFISALWRNYGLLQQGITINAMFALGAGLGTAGWFTFLTRFIAKRQRGFKPSTLSRINLAAGIALFVFGLYFLYQIIFLTNWQQLTGAVKSNSEEIQHK